MKILVAVFVRQQEKAALVMVVDPGNQQVLLGKILHPERSEPGVERMRILQYYNPLFQDFVADLFREQD
jgi:hypothetical protein